MGVVVETLRDAFRLGRKASPPVGAAIPTWTTQAATAQPWSYEAFAREGYGANELVYACIEELATSAAEPRFAVTRATRKGDVQLPRHPALTVLNRPNRFLSRFAFVAGMIVYYYLAGNAYVEIVRSAAGKPVELWLLRPDRVRVIPHTEQFIAGYSYEVGDKKFFLPPQDVIHIRHRNPLDEFYGMPPLAPAAARVDIDNWMRSFVGSFFRNAGVPAGMLNVMSSLDKEDKESIRRRWRSEYGGANGWHNLLVIDGGQAKYEPMGMPIGGRGLAVPELEDVNEARIAMVFQVPLSLIGARLGMASSSYANRASDRQMFWYETLTPLYSHFADALTHALTPEYPDIDAILFDLATVRALQPDVDALHKRVTADFQAGLITQQEARTALGYPPEAEVGGVFVLAVNMVPTAAPLEVPEPLDEPATAGEADEDGEGDDAGGAA